MRANLPMSSWVGGPGTEAAVLNLNPESATFRQIEHRPVVYLYELKHDLNAYLRDWAKGTAMHSMADIIAFNTDHADRALRFGQDIFLASEASQGGLEAAAYMSARQMDIRTARTLGIDAYMDEHQLDAILFPGRNGAAIAAKAGYPSVMIPAGMVEGAVGGTKVEYPFGATFTGRAWSEATLLRFAYAIEQAMPARRLPPGLPALQPGCADTVRTSE